MGVAVDDTKLHKTGRCIHQAFYQRDPLSPPFHTNLILGLRFLQASLLVPLHKRAAASCRALPIRFEESSRVKRRIVRYKEIEPVYWQGGARKQPLRLIVVAPTPYRKRNSGKLYYHNPAYLLTTDLVDNAKALLQIYFDRWQIEVNHREEKDSLGVGQAQLWNPTSVPRQPVLVVAAYRALLLAALLAFGPQRAKEYAQLPKWRRNANRPSCLDLITLLRKEMDEHPEMLMPLGIDTSLQGLARAAAA